jgi:hypothetical protein
MTVVPQDAPRSEDGQWWWDGSTWQPLAGGDAPAGASSPAQDSSGTAATATGQLSEDGQWEWDGSQWQRASTNGVSAGAPAEPTLYEGDLDVDGAVETLQLALARGGHAVTVDGKFGYRTKDAVVAFQREHGLEPDGVVGNATWAALMEREAVPPGVNNPPHGGLYPAHDQGGDQASQHAEPAPQTPASTVSESGAYTGYLDVQNFGFGRYRLRVAEINDPDKMASLMFPGGKPASLEISYQAESESDGVRLESFDIAHVTVEALGAMAQPFVGAIENAIALESPPPTPEEVEARQARDRQEQAAFRAGIIPHLDPAGAVTGAMIVDDFNTWAGVRSTHDGWIVWVGRFPGGIEVSGFDATDLDDEGRSRVVASLQYYFDQGMTAERAQIQLEVDFQNDLRLVLSQVALAFIAA